MCAIFINIRLAANYALVRMCTRGIQYVSRAAFKNTNLKAKARKVCGNDTFCVFDIAATSKVEVGMSTLQGSQEFERIVELFAPGMAFVFYSQCY